MEKKNDSHVKSVPKRYARKNGLERHIDGIHRQMKNNVCTGCNYSTPWKATFVRHIKGAHLKIEDVLCPFASNSHSESSLSHESYSPIKSTKNYHATAHETGTHDDNGYEFSYIDHN